MLWKLDTVLKQAYVVIIIIIGVGMCELPF